MVQPEKPSKFKRKHSRVNIDLKGDLRILQPKIDRQVYPGQVQTIGGGGLMILSAVPLLVGTPLQIRLYHQSNVITVNSRVVWSEPERYREGSGFKCGLQYDPMQQASLLDIDFLIQDSSR